MPPVGPVERAEDVQQRALAGARGAHDRDELAVGDADVDAAQGVHGRGAFAEHLHERARLEGREFRMSGHSATLRA